MLKADAQTRSRTWTPGRLAVAALAVGLPLAAWIASIRWGNGNPVEAAVEGSPMDDLAFFALLAAPAVLGFLGIWRPALFIAGGVAALLIGISPLVVTAPLLVVGIIYLVAFARSEAELGLRGVVAIIVASGFAIAAPVVFVTGSQQTVCWTTVELADGTTEFRRDAAEELDMADGSGSAELGVPVEGRTATGGGCTSGAIPKHMSMNVLAVAATACIAGWLIASPRETHLPETVE
jgi:hypothetical protein